MANILILFDDQAVGGTLSGGSWEASLPLTNMQDEKLSKVARSSDVTTESTQFDLAMPSVEFGFRAVIAGPTNLTTSHKYRVKAYNDAAKTSVAYNSDWVQDFSRVTFGTLAWGHPSLWTGFLAQDDPDRGVWIIHIIDASTYPSGISERIWSIEIDDESNPDGYVQIGRLFMGQAWQPPINYSPDRNQLTFGNNSKMVQALSGAKSRRDVLGPRIFTFGFDRQAFADADLYDEAYRLMRDSGFAGQVYIIPNPDDSRTQLGRRSMLGTISEMDGLTQAAAGYGGAGYVIEEQL